MPELEIQRYNGVNTFQAVCHLAAFLSTHPKLAPQANVQWSSFVNVLARFVNTEIFSHTDTGVIGIDESQLDTSFTSTSTLRYDDALLASPPPTPRVSGVSKADFPPSSPIKKKVILPSVLSDLDLQHASSSQLPSGVDVSRISTDVDDATSCSGEGDHSVLQHASSIEEPVQITPEHIAYLLKNPLAGHVVLSVYMQLFYNTVLYPVLIQHGINPPEGALEFGESPNSYISDALLVVLFGPEMIRFPFLRVEERGQLSEAYQQAVLEEKIASEKLSNAQKLLKEISLTSDEKEKQKQICQRQISKIEKAIAKKTDIVDQYKETVKSYAEILAQAMYGELLQLDFSKETLDYAAGYADRRLDLFSPKVHLSLLRGSTWGLEGVECSHISAMTSSNTLLEATVSVGEYLSKVQQLGMVGYKQEPIDGVDTEDALTDPGELNLERRYASFGNEILFGIYSSDYHRFFSVPEAEIRIAEAERALRLPSDVELPHSLVEIYQGSTILNSENGCQLQEWLSKYVLLAARPYQDFFSRSASTIDSRDLKSELDIVFKKVKELEKIPPEERDQTWYINHQKAWDEIYTNNASPACRFFVQAKTDGLIEYPYFSDSIQAALQYYRRIGEQALTTTRWGAHGNHMAFDVPKRVFELSLQRTKTEEEQKAVIENYIKYLAHYDFYDFNAVGVLPIAKILLNQWRRKIDLCIRYDRRDLIPYVTQQSVRDPWVPDKEKEKFMRAMRYVVRGIEGPFPAWGGGTLCEKLQLNLLQRQLLPPLSDSDSAIKTKELFSVMVKLLSDSFDSYGQLKKEDQGIYRIALRLVLADSSSLPLSPEVAALQEKATQLEVSVEEAMKDYEALINRGASDGNLSLPMKKDAVSDAMLKNFRCAHKDEKKSLSLTRLFMQIVRCQDDPVVRSISRGMSSAVPSSSNFSIATPNVDSHRRGTFSGYPMRMTPGR